ncbi:FG-GAP repeat protein [Streptomyces turgidiscabies]|nr:FG-GAP repeat protein [Streptomyces turgidiscabies]
MGRARRGPLAALLAFAVSLLVVFTGVTPASATVGTNDYPSYLASPAGDALVDPWQFYNRECTSFVAWRLNNDNGVDFTNNMAHNGVNGHWGNAYQWKNNAIALGYTYNGSPAPGSIGWYDVNYHGAGSAGHVLYVDSVNATDGSIVAEDYNGSTPMYNYRKRTIAAGSSAWPSGFIHISDVVTPPPPPPPPPPPASDNSGTFQGDYNGDGKTDVASFYDYSGGHSALFVWIGNGSGGFAAPVKWWDSGVGGWDQFRTKPFVGDFNGDGKADVGVQYKYDNVSTAIFTFTSTGSAFGSPVSKWSSGGANSWDWGQSSPVVGDYNGDGKADLALMYGYTGATTSLFVLNGDGAGNFASPVSWWNSGAGSWDATGAKLVAGDLNGDGKTDLEALYNYGSDRSAVFTFLTGSGAFNAPVKKWDSGASNTWAWSYSKPLMGDFNGDGTPDMGVVYGYPTTERVVLYVFDSTGSGNVAAPRTGWDSGEHSWGYSQIKPFVGEFTGDTKADIGMYFAYEGDQTAQFLFASNGSTFGSPANTWDSGAGNWNGLGMKIA